MDDVTLEYAKHHLEELIERAARGETVRILHPVIGPVQLAAGGAPSHLTTNEPQSPILRRPGSLKGLKSPPDGFFDALSADELRLWYGGEK